MLIKPSIDTLLKKVDSKYTLVIAASQRGRQIREEVLVQKSEDKLGGFSTGELKEISIALDEIASDKLTYDFIIPEEVDEGLASENSDELHLLEEQNVSLDHADLIDPPIVETV